MKDGTMTQDTLCQSAQDLDRSRYEEHPMTTSGESEPSTDLSVESELPETWFVASEEPPEGGDLEGVPWWKRIFAFAHRPSVEAIADVVPSEETALRGRVSLSEVAEAAPEEIQPEVPPPCNGAPEASSPEEESAPDIAASAAPVLGAPVLSEAEGVEGFPLTLDDVRALVWEEMSHTREEVSRIVRAELARGRQDRRSGSLLVSQELVADTSEAKLGLLAAELDVLNDEEQRALQDPDVPLHERIELVDFVRGRRAQVERQIVEVEAALAKRVAETDLALAELEGRGIVASLREELKRQEDQISKYTNQQEELAQRAARRPLIGVGAGVVPALLALVLVAAVGVAGVLLPRQADAAPSFLVEMATLYQATGEKEAAIELLDEAVEAGIHGVDTLGQVGQTYYALKEYQKAIEVLGQAVENAPQNEGLYLTLARSYGEAGHHQEAIAQYERLIEISPGNWRYHLEMGQQYEALEDYDQALAQYQKVAELAPDRLEGYTSQGSLHRDLERYDAAIEQYQRALEINPNAVWIRLKLGQSYVGLENWGRAIEQFGAAAELAPNNPSPYLEIGKVWRAQGEYEVALSRYQYALDAQADHVPTLLELGDTYLELGDCEQATLQFLKVLEMKPNNRSAQDGLKVCLGE
jgi:tetratricopeptide (TPR) repeat protein